MKQTTAAISHSARLLLLPPPPDDAPILYVPRSPLFLFLSKSMILATKIIFFFHFYFRVASVYMGAMDAKEPS